MNIIADICFIPKISTFYCDVIDDVIVVKMTYFYVFWAKEPDSEIRMQISLKLPKIEKWRFLQTLTPYELLNRKWNRKLKGSSQCAFRYATFQFLFRCSSLNINRVIAIWKFWGFCDLVNSTFDLPSRKTIHIISGQGNNWWCGLVKISQSVRELSRSERTHRQTHKHMKDHSESETCRNVTFFC